MKWFDYSAPSSLSEALKLLRENSQALLLAGGTDLLVQMRAGRKQTDLVIDIKNIAELNQLVLDASGLRLGAAVPCYRIYNHRDIARGYPALSDVASLIGGTQIQGRASIGGNLCNAAPSADAVPLLIALGAICRIAGPSGERTVPVEEFCTAPGKTVLKQGELLVSLHLPPPKPHSGAAYLRFIPRNEMDIAVAGAGVSVELNNGNFQSVRIALGAVAPTPLYAKQAGDSLAGKPVNDACIQTAAELAKAAASPITDMRGTAEYRRHLCAVLTARALKQAIQRAQEAK